MLFAPSQNKSISKSKEKYLSLSSRARASVSSRLYHYIELKCTLSMQHHLFSLLLSSL